MAAAVALRAAQLAQAVALLLAAVAIAATAFAFVVRRHYRRRAGRKVRRWAGRASSSCSKNRRTHASRR